MANNDNSTLFVTGEVRLSYAHLFRLYANPQNRNAEPKYSVTVLLPKSDIQSKQRLDAAINAAIQVGVAKKWGNQRPPRIDVCVHDGDGVKDNGTPFGDECKGHWVFTASGKDVPKVVDLNLNPILIESDVYSGCYARVSVNFFAYSSLGKNGIGAGLRCVQKLRDGEPLGNTANPENDFGAAMPGYAPAGAFPGQGGYNSPSPTYQQQPPYMNQPAQAPYNAGQFVNPVQPMQPTQPYGQPSVNPGQPAQAIDPITGRPIGQGGIYGI